MKFKSQTSTRLQFGGMRLDSATSTKDEQLVNVGGNNQNKTKKSKNKKKIIYSREITDLPLYIPLGNFYFKSGRHDIGLIWGSWTLR